MAKFVYFDLPGRGETSRLIANLGKLAVEDAKFPREQWPTIKPTTPFGQAPFFVREDGAQLAQSFAIERYLAKQADLLPVGDDWEVAQAEAVYGFVGDIWDLFSRTNVITDAEARAKAQKEAVAGPLPDKLAKLAALLEGKQYIAGGKLSYVDLHVYSKLSVLASGFLDTIPKDVLAPYPAIIAYHDGIANIPAIKELYAGASEGVYAAFKPFAA